MIYVLHKYWVLIIFFSNKYIVIINQRFFSEFSESDVLFSAKYDGVSIIQPENAIKKITPDYAEFTIPGGKKGDVPEMKLVKVDSLDTTGQLVFRDIKEFNRIQSEVFPVAYHSNENMLVCAPTGAGKTNIALLAIVHQIRCHIEANLIRKNDFKVKQ